MFSAIKKTIAKTSGSISEIYDQYWDQIVDKVQVSLSDSNQSIKNVASNDRLLKTIFEGAHDSMPLPFRLIVKQASFVEFCFTNRDKLVSIDIDESGLVPVTNGKASIHRTITKKEMLVALKDIPDDAYITVTVDELDYENAKKQYPDMKTVVLGVPGDNSYDEEGISFLTWPLKPT